MRTATFVHTLALLAAGVFYCSNSSIAADAVVPGELRATPTIHCIGLYWPLQGDANGNAAATVEFQEAGADTWKQALPLWRVVPQTVDVEANTIGGIKVLFAGGIKRWGGMQQYLIEKYSQNYIAGSIFNLKPATHYVIRVTLTDPDGGGLTRTIETTTRAIPVLPDKGNMIEVKGGGAALAQALTKAKPGDIFIVSAGTYTPFVIKASGTAEKPIVIRPAGNGEVIIQGPTPLQNFEEGNCQGIEVTGSYIHLHKLTIKECHDGVRLRNKASTDNSVTSCTFVRNWTAIYYGGSNGYYADNTITGIKGPGRVGGDVTEGHAFADWPAESGVGNVICYNTITRVSDAIRLHCTDADAYGNDVLFGSDDAVEYDDGGPNLRVWGNRFTHPGNNGLSYQPYIGGPAYAIRNLVFVATEDVIKDRYKSCGAIWINNTFVEAGTRNAEAITPPEHTFARNNLFVSTRRSSVKYHAEDFVRQPATLDLDFNGYNKLLGAPAYDTFNLPVHNAGTVADIHKRTGLETHGVQLNAESCFKDPLPDAAELQQAITKWTGRHPDFSLKQGSPAIDKGEIIPNIADVFEGASPDLGALEFGAPLPHWGVRPEAQTSR